MGLFQWLRQKSESSEKDKKNSEEKYGEDFEVKSSHTHDEENTVFTNNIVEEAKQEEVVEFDDLKFLEGEKEEVAAVVSACLAGAGDGLKYRIKSITKVDPDLEACALIASSCFVGERDNVKLRIKNIYRIK